MPHYFVTGATGFIGSHVVDELLKHGHTVTGLARSEKSAQSLISKGCSVARGEIDDVELLEKTAAASDGVIHLAAPFTGGMEQFLALDHQAIEFLIKGLRGTGKPFVGCSGTLVVASTPLADNEPPYNEDSPPMTDGVIGARAANEIFAIEQSKLHGVQGSVVRLPPSVHGAGDHGLIPYIFDMARATGSVSYIGQGESYWSAVHVKDAAVCYRLVAEQKLTGYLHATADVGIPTREISETIAKTLNLPVRAIPRESAIQEVGFVGMLFAYGGPVSSEKTKKLTGWSPKEVGLLEDISNNYYNVKSAFPVVNPSKEFIKD